MNWKKYAAISLRVFIGLLFLYAGISKVMDPGKFIADLGRFQLLPEFLLAPAAIYLPYLEIFTGLALVTGLFYRGALLLTKGMLLVFSIGLASAWWRGIEISCKCFGENWGDLPIHWALVRNILLLATTLALILFSLRTHKNPAKESPAFRAPR